MLNDMAVAHVGTSSWRWDSAKRIDADSDDVRVEVGGLPNPGVHVAFSKSCNRGFR